MTSTDTTLQADRCPACGSKGRAVSARTVESLTTAEALHRVAQRDGFRFCAEPACEVAYFRAAPAERILRGEVRVRIGQKETAAPRPVCHCFGHTVEEIEEDVARTGGSPVVDEITAKCREGLARCEETNPQGACCLGNVRVAVHAAQARLASRSADAHPVEPADACCAAAGTAPASDAVQAAPSRTARAGVWTSVGAVVSAVFSSACCWLPLLLVAFGASAAGVAGFFESYRPWLLSATALLLGSGFYLAYFRRPSCAPGGACAVPSARRSRTSRAMLWVATTFALAFALFPNYVGVLLGASDTAAETAAPAAGGETRTFRIEGMTCEACSAILRERLSSVPGVARADVSFAEKTARVAFLAAGPRPTDADVDGAIRAAGYRGTPVEDAGAPASASRAR
jgi:copper chaperone CopZ